MEKWYDAIVRNMKANESDLVDGSTIVEVILVDTPSDARFEDGDVFVLDAQDFDSVPVEGNRIQFRWTRRFVDAQWEDAGEVVNLSDGVEVERRSSPRIREFAGPDVEDFVLETSVPITFSSDKFNEKPELGDFIAWVTELEIQECDVDTE